MTLGILLLLVRKLPDFFVRTLVLAAEPGPFPAQGASACSNLPTSGPVILATNCDRLEAGPASRVGDGSLDVVRAVGEARRTATPRSLCGRLANRSNVVEMSRADHAGWLAAHERAKKALGTATSWRSPSMATPTTKSSR